MADVNPDVEREKQIARLLAEYEKRLRREYPRKLPTLDEIERTAQKIGEGIKQDIQQEIVDSIDPEQTPADKQCSCGSRRLFKHISARHIVTLHGELLLRRRYYWCPSCRQGCYPVDVMLGLPKGSVSVSVRALVCRFVSIMPYRKAAHELELICGVHLSVSTLERIANETGHCIKQMWEQRQETVQTETFGRRDKVPERTHVSMDGVMAHVGGRWREVKLGVFFEPADGGPVNERYCATLQNSAQFGMQLKTLSTFNGGVSSKHNAVLADGSDWIWQEAGKHFTQSVHILDFFHVTEHLWQVAHARFGQDRKEAESWIAQQKRYLLETRTGAEDVIRDIQAWDPVEDTARHVRRTQLAYLQNHRNRMKYVANKEAGFNLGSGVMESSCRWVVQQRMKGSGMRWQEHGATAMLHLRTTWCGNADADMINATRKAAFNA